MKNEQRSIPAWEIEDYLQSHNVFVSGIDGRPAHSDSYMTVVDFKQLDIAFAENPFSMEDWKDSIENCWWDSISVCLKLVARTAKRRFNL